MALAFTLFLAAQLFCMTPAERDLARDQMLDALDTSLRAQVRRMIDVRHRDKADDPARILSGLRGAIEAYAKSRRAVLQWSPVLCQPLPVPRPNTG